MQIAFLSVWHLDVVTFRLKPLIVYHKVFLSKWWHNAGLRYLYKLVRWWRHSPGSPYTSGSFWSGGFCNQLEYDHEFIRFFFKFFFTPHAQYGNFYVVCHLIFLFFSSTKGLCWDCIRIVFNQLMAAKQHHCSVFCVMCIDMMVKTFKTLSFL